MYVSPPGVQTNPLRPVAAPAIFSWGEGGGGAKARTHVERAEREPIRGSGGNFYYNNY